MLQERDPDRLLFFEEQAVVHALAFSVRSRDRHGAQKAAAA
jgi:hypothetical protein